MTRRRGARRGFTLVSVLVAVTLLAIGVMAVGRTQALTVAATANAANRQMAVEIGRSRMEFLRALPPDSLASDSVEVNDRGIPTPNGRFHRAVVVTNVSANLRQVQLRVHYPRQTAPVRFTTLIYRP